MSFKNILVCIDGSESSIRAGDLAVEMAKRNGSQLIAINVIVSQVGYSYVSGMFGLSTPSAINELLDKSRQEADRWFDQVKARASVERVNFRTDVIVSPTTVLPAILSYAESNKVDLIVSGTKGRSGFTKFLLGSVASGLVTHSPSPVLVVK